MPASFNAISSTIPTCPITFFLCDRFCSRFLAFWGLVAKKAGSVPTRYTQQQHHNHNYPSPTTPQSAYCLSSFPRQSNPDTMTYLTVRERLLQGFNTSFGLNQLLAASVLSCSYVWSCRTKKWAVIFLIKKRPRAEHWMESLGLKAAAQ